MLVIVTPFVGVWIETSKFARSKIAICVTPFVGVWIETLSRLKPWHAVLGHTLRGCVD